MAEGEGTSSVGTSESAGSTGSLPSSTGTAPASTSAASAPVESTIAEPQADTGTEGEAGEETAQVADPAAPPTDDELLAQYEKPEETAAQAATETAKPGQTQAQAELPEDLGAMVAEVSKAFSDELGENSPASLAMAKFAKGVVQKISEIQPTLTEAKSATTQARVDHARRINQTIDGIAKDRGLAAIVGRPDQKTGLYTNAQFAMRSAIFEEAQKVSAKLNCDESTAYRVAVAKLFGGSQTKTEAAKQVMGQVVKRHDMRSPRPSTGGGGGASVSTPKAISEEQAVKNIAKLMRTTA